VTISIDPAINTYLAGAWAPVADERDDPGLQVSGKLPAGLRGAFLRTGPNPAFPPRNGRYHFFDGDGMVHAVYLDGEGGASYKNRWVRSAGLEAERRAGEALYSSLVAYEMPDPEKVGDAGFMKNTGNTALVRHAGRLFALMEAARPTELTLGLETVGEWDFGCGFAGSMTAHPKVDPVTGEMLFFGYSPIAPYLRYHVVNAAGQLVNSVDIDLPAPVMMHDFVVTDRHAVFFDLPAIFDVERMFAGGDALSFEPERGARIGVLARDGSSTNVRWFEIDVCYVFHFLNAWETDGRIVVIGCRADTLGVAFADDNRVGAEDNVGVLYRWTIDLDSGAVHEEQLDDRRGDFPQIDPRRAAQRNQYGYVGLMRKPESGPTWFGGVAKYDLDSGTVQTHDYGAAAESGEVVFAPDPDGTAEDDGWLCTIVQEAGASALVVLDAHDLDEVARVHIPRRVPHGFHALWVAAD